MIKKLIKTKEDYTFALSRIDELMDAKAGTHKADELELLATLVELYEEKNYPIGMPDPVDARLRDVPSYIDMSIYSC